MNSSKLYLEYVEKMQQLADLRNIHAVLGWDQETYLPPKGATGRSRQMTTISVLSHQFFSDPHLGDLLRQLDQREDLSFTQKKNVSLSLEDFEKNLKYPPAFVAQLSQVTSSCFHSWVKARKENNYALFQPDLDSMVKMKKEEAEILGFTDHPYNALLNEFEKGITIQQLDGIFTELKSGLLPLIKRIAATPLVDYTFLRKFYPKEKQWSFGLQLLKEIGFDGEAGRQDISEHPFTTSFNHQDVRVTTRVDPSDLSEMIWCCLHEGGHALYEQGLSGLEYGLPGGEAASLGIHESQSRLWENNVGRSNEFWKKYYPVLQELFPENLNTVDLEEFYRSINQVKPVLVRTEADELTYHFHVMIRYEIEKDLISGQMDTHNLDEIWRDRYREYLDLQVNDDKNGVLQDIHWSHGSFGYFPTYTLGSLYAAQFFNQAGQDIPHLDDQLSSGENVTLLSWLRKNIHSKGRWWTSEELCKNITGQGLQCSFFLQEARRKYGEIYGW